MKTISLIKSFLHAFAGIIVLVYAWLRYAQNNTHTVVFGALGVFILLAAVLHWRYLANSALKTSLFFVFESLVLAVIAWQLYQLGMHKATFFYEGVSVMFFSLAAYSYLLRKKPELIFTEHG